MIKLVIANWGRGERGKSSSIKRVYDILQKKYPHTLYLNNGDIKATIQIDDVLVGLESQGDPKSRQGDSLKDFLSWGCGVIICASRCYGETRDNINDLKKHGYQVVWTQNDRSDDSSLHADLNQRYAEYVVQMIEDRIAGRF